TKQRRSAAAPRIPGRCAFWVVMLVWSIGQAAGASEPVAAPREGPVLHLTNGGLVPGWVRDSDRVGVLRWQGASFIQPFAFAPGTAEWARFPAPASAGGRGEPERAAADLYFEMAGGDVLFGTLVELDDRAAVVEAPELGRLHIRRSQIHRISRRDDQGG